MFESKPTAFNQTYKENASPEKYRNRNDTLQDRQKDLSGFENLTSLKDNYNKESRIFLVMPLTTMS